MANPPIKKTAQDGFIKTALRLPPDLHAEVHDLAKYHGRTFNAEIISRLRAMSVNDQLTALRRENAEIKASIKELLSL